MRNSTFLKVLLAAFVLAVLYGAVFYGGVALGRNQVEPEQSSEAQVSGIPTPGTGIPETITFTADDMAEIREQMQAMFGEELPEAMQRRLDQFSEGGTIDLAEMRRRRQEMGIGDGPGLFRGGGGMLDDNR